MIKITDDAWPCWARQWKSCHELQISDFLDSRWKYFICECIFTTFHKTMYTTSIILYLFLLLLDCESNAITNFFIMMPWKPILCAKQINKITGTILLTIRSTVILSLFQEERLTKHQKNIHQVHRCKTSISPHRSNRFLTADLLFCWLFLEMLRLVWAPTT